MTTYQLSPIIRGYTTVQAIILFNENNTITSIPVNADNSNYQNFKLQINDETAQLEDADGVLMSPEAAKAYVATLP